METCSDFLLERLYEWGIRRIYGYPGDGINGIMGALGRVEKNSHAIEFIQARHEEMAAFMACGHAKFTGEVGVCLATSGPGAIHLLNGLYDAKMDHVPLVAIVGQQSRQGLGGHYQQEVDLTILFKDVASEFIQMGSRPEIGLQLMIQKTGENRLVIRYSEAFKMEVVRELEASGTTFEAMRRKYGIRGLLRIA
jgi:pyruvate dehydrogenase (quinone)